MINIKALLISHNILDLKSGAWGRPDVTLIEKERKHEFQFHQYSRVAAGLLDLKAGDADLAIEADVRVLLCAHAVGEVDL